MQLCEVASEGGGSTDLTAETDGHLRVQLRTSSFEAVAVAPLAASLSHSCIPNVQLEAGTVLSEGTRGKFGVGMLALRDIAPGETLERAYVQHNRPLVERQRELERTGCMGFGFGFRCSCVRCRYEAVGDMHKTPTPAQCLLLGHHALQVSPLQPLLLNIAPCSSSHNT